MNEYGCLEAEEILRDDHKSIAKVALTGLNKPVINHGSDTTYEVLCGEGVVEIDFDVVELRRGVTWSVPQGTPYQDEALSPRLIVLATCEPPFDQEKVEYLD